MSNLGRNRVDEHGTRNQSKPWVRTDECRRLVDATLHTLAFAREPRAATARTPSVLHKPCLSSIYPREHVQRSQRCDTRCLQKGAGHMQGSESPKFAEGPSLGRL